ncbi:MULTISPECIES: ABC transporter permease [unclassified Paenibacillus]|uniref:ABC transporter permease n=1 Tax=unclassified Paenibacillus TaxID=185978 RepID=UPI0024063112|nr:MULTISPECIES: ABC transporter permease [unclassified Paenibacillus]MDF9843798.1 ABC-type uncharacterized transport system permease subunit [Paenibacillus sp. PastF-2]MDF9850363.1 ABC-type uncharacterized transport system permease subunit [Paenibacillus sp. PastM-2]MDF9856934.1 ABC-type uncharacterized transport system permease subunit [Paenibacillus sp. PastF-1]MDH6482209.1 ABC-type uncharacterized transport system permease subunit [Paenibacillus sp. PastH-2]MDH6509627.1 ABC-type uncharacte
MREGNILSAWLKVLLPSVIAVAVSLLIGAAVIAMIGESPLEAYAALFKGSLGGSGPLSQTLERSTPYLFGGLAFALAAKAGLFNIGLEGQMFIGALASAVAGFGLQGLPPFVHLPLAVAAGMAGGMLWAVVPGVMKVKAGVHEVISTVMLNYVAFAVTGYLTVHQFLEKGAVAQTPKVAPEASLPLLAPPSKVNAGLLIGLGCAVLLYVLLYHTAWGYALRVNGLNGIAARYAGISSGKMIFMALLFSGALAGLMGAERVLGVYQRFMQTFSSGYGFTAIAVALLGRNHPLGIIPAAFIFGMLESGASSMSLMVDVPRELGPILQAVIIVVIASAAFLAGKVDRRKGVKAVG